MNTRTALPSAFLAVATSSFALNTGDIAFTGFNADGNDNLAFVALAPIPSGTEIHFTDNEWTGSGFNTGESGFTWTATANIAAGNIVTIDSIGTGTAVSNLGSVFFFEPANRGLSNSDEIVYAYQGTTTAPSVFLSAIANDALTTGATLPAGLVAGTNAIEFVSTDADMDIAAYNAARTGLSNFAAYRALLNDPVQWITQDASGDQSIDLTPPDVPFSTTPFTAGITSVDLATYVRIGRYDLPEPTRTTPPTDNLLCQEASGVSYNWDTDTLFIVGDGGRSVTQVSKTGALVDTMTLASGTGPQGTEFYDIEGITYIGGGQFVMSEERERQLVKFTYAAGTTLARSATQTVKIGTFVDNTGTEGLSWDPHTAGFICLKEISPMGLFQTGMDFDLGTATNGSPTTENSINLFDPLLTGMSDFADVFALSNLPSMDGQAQEENLLVLSQEDGRVVNINRSGVIHSTLNIQTDAGNPFTVGGQQHEGITMDRSGRIYIVSENGGGSADHPQLWVYEATSASNQAPTLVAVENALNPVMENTSTANALKIADVVVTDDGLGTNTLSLSGADAASFELSGTALYLKAGTLLDYETKTSFSITISVDDTTVGSTPDLTTIFTLNVGDDTNEQPPAPKLLITEVAPWSSGNSPVGSDWFEVTNISAEAVDITGWKFDDDSASFGSAVALSGITSIAPGESVIFLETNDLPTKSALFISNWFGSNPPAGLQIGNYTGSGIGLGSGGDQVNLFNASGLLQAKVSFGASPTGTFASFDNTVADNNVALTLLSVAGVHGAAVAVNSPNEVGSPGYSAPGLLRITEVAPWSSGTSTPVGADWFEVTNVGGRSINIEGWRVDDSSETFAGSLPLFGVTDIAAGESVIFFETATPATTHATFLSTWFGSNPPAGLQLGSYSGSSIGLSTGGDAVNLYNTDQVRVANLSFGQSPSGPILGSFDNTAAVNVGAVTLKSVPGVNGAFLAANDPNEIGSPGVWTSGGPLDFALWLSSQGFASRGFDADSDGDGITDGIEFFFNQSPNNGGDLANLPHLTSINGGLQLSFTRLTNTGGINGGLQVSSDLQTWVDAISAVDYVTAGEIVDGDETSVTYSLPGTGPSAPGVSATYMTPNTSTPSGASLGGVRVINEGLVGAGRISGENVDSFGETQGAASGLFVTDWAWNGTQFSGKFQVLPDRGYNSGSIFSNYAARLHQVDFTFTPYYGSTPVAQTQIAASYASSTKFTYLDGSTPKFTTGLNPTGVSSLFGQQVGMVIAANGPGGAQESLLSFDAEAVHLFADGSGFVSDEYGTYIARFNAAKQITGLTQLPESARPHRSADTLNFNSVAAPTNGRRNNQGLEGMSVTPDDNRLFALLQSATVQDTNGSQQQTRNHARLYVYDIAGANRENPVLIGEYVVKLPQIDLNGNGSALDGTAAQSEIVAIGDNAFLMLPRDGNGMGRGTTDPIVFKSVQLVDFASATNILGLQDGVGAQISPAGVLAPGINAAATAEIINILNPADLAKFGFNTNTNPANSNTINEKMEGMALAPDLSTPQPNDFFLFVANDNDFQSSDVKMVDATGALVSYGDGRLNAGITNDAVFYAWRITIDTGKKFFRVNVEEAP
ncbi:esterase-like activity of phytase family protein [Luteolibacter sp. GHJ8]|uniref:Esterase-like activity of phytase family protein n=1 Tax=Luteolibacter rhizosphaerae TaxID=2989719 RepID=A0ABT3FX13_9BACT|nr:esterase-like activity of phytase family protein [Luteolibacter rhizosphaerae]MCW1912130.1 esterase-like activity of phytase family protein [Luteolibacter rhizosphaerae]